MPSRTPRDLRSSQGQGRGGGSGINRQIDGNPAFYLLAGFEKEFFVCRPREQKCFIGPHAPGSTGTMIIFQDKILMLVARDGSAVGTRMTQHFTHAEYFLFVRSMEMMYFRAPPHFT